jgi:hypothetical protein
MTLCRQPWRLTSSWITPSAIIHPTVPVIPRYYQLPQLSSGRIHRTIQHNSNARHVHAPIDLRNDMVFLDGSVNRIPVVSGKAMAFIKFQALILGITVYKQLSHQTHMFFTPSCWPCHYFSSRGTAIERRRLQPYRLLLFFLRLIFQRSSLLRLAFHFLLRFHSTSSSTLSLWELSCRVSVILILPTRKAGSGEAQEKWWLYSILRYIITDY